MDDIFMSYASSDRERIAPLVNGLEQRGWSVWWDPEIPHGGDFRQVIDKALDEAKCVLVVWSRNSVLSPWVIDEADEGRRQKKLVPILIDDVEVPLGFRQIQTAQLMDWQGESYHSEFEKLLKSIEGILVKTPDSIPAEKIEEDKPSKGKYTQPHSRWAQIAAGAGIVTVIIAAIIVYKIFFDIKAPEIVYFEATPETIEKGESTTLSWKTSNAKEVRIRHRIGDVSLSGSKRVRPAETTTYTLVAANADGKTAEKEVTVEVTASPSSTIYSKGQVVIRGTWLCDLDLGVETSEKGADFWWEQVDGTRRYIVPRNGARLSVIGIRDFDSIVYSDLTQLAYSSDKIDGSNATYNQIPQGTVVAAVTNEGRYSKFKIENYGYNLTISWVTYEPY